MALFPSILDGNTNTGWVKLNNSYEVYYIVFNGIVFVQTRYTGTSISAGNKYVGTLPSGCWPAYRVNVRDGAGNNGYLQIDANGEVYINPSQQTTYFQCMTSYPCT